MTRLRRLTRLLRRFRANVCRLFAVGLPPRPNGPPRTLGSLGRLRHAADVGLLRFGTLGVRDSRFWGFLLCRDRFFLRVRLR